MNADTAGDRPKMPKWVKVFLAIGIALAVLLVGVLIFGGSEHGPGRHGGSHEETSGTSTGNHTAPTPHHAAPSDDGQPGAHPFRTGDRF